MEDSKRVILFPRILLYCREDSLFMCEAKLDLFHEVLIIH
jgi:hypothetical protein